MNSVKPVAAIAAVMLAGGSSSAMAAGPGSAQAEREHAFEEIVVTAKAQPGWMIEHAAVLVDQPGALSAVGPIYESADIVLTVERPRVDALALPEIEPVRPTLDL